ncbi:cell division protein ZipA [Shewanella colwelliana]|uniref:cell division protein ZipA n=1 Tax=Shewanella colwelliana TaxID=23 RepID=UPI00048E084E|nr:cell division protein ZipA [Shewanella colwelliana]
MENLQLVLFVLGAIAIIAVLVHGFWSIRRQQPKSLKETPMTGLYKGDARDRDGFDADGIGEVRVRKLSGNEAPVGNDTDSEDDTAPHDDGAVVEPKMGATIEPQSANSFSLSGQPKQKASRQRQEPVLSTELELNDELEQMELGLGQAPAQPSLFEDPVVARKPEPAAKPQSAVTAASPVQDDVVEATTPPLEETAELEQEAPLGDPQDVLVLHVVAKEGEALNGAELLPSLLTLNFKFGEMDIFHRHEDNAGTGKVLFSLANMLKPGIFNPDEMEQFTTQGIVLFMTLPCYGDPLMNFSIMLNSAHQLADDLGGLVLDGGRSSWSEQTKQSYLQRIRAQA